jgi:Arc/MetJ family transcription regulator
MRTTVDIDPALLAEAQRVSGYATKRQIIEEALRLLIKLRGQREVDAAFGRYRWRGNLARSRKDRQVTLVSKKPRKPDGHGIV